ncbi:MAG: lantibiotic dehydratase family protein, partial [Chitinophagaceae bacterium]|nr:lantibiotic dehydratase family protein [Chitinophagaceae bacterium]
EPVAVIMSQSAIELPFTFLDRLVLRTPALPFINLLDEAKADALIDDQFFMEAVYLASPVLYAECTRLIKGELTDKKEIKKIRTSLIKYYQRMYSRCTPFGLFSGCSLARWGDEQSHITLSADKFFRSTRLDMHYLCALGQQLSSLPVIQERLSFFPNNSAYRIGNEVRYIEYRYQKGRRVHQISSVLHSEYLDAVLERTSSGARIHEIVDLLVAQQEVSAEEAISFIEEMISSQVLISEMDPAITGEEFIHQLLAVLDKINFDKNAAITAIHDKLEYILASLKEIDNKAHNSTEIYVSLIEKINELTVPFEDGKLLQVDAFSKPLPNTIKSEWQNDLLSTFGLLAKLFSSTVNENLSSFAERFRKRYEDQQVPLLQVLDAETGIGYTERASSNLSPLVENLVLPGRNGGDSFDIKWNKTEQWLFDKLIRNPGEREIIIEASELKEFADDFSNFPP